jgi:glucokinase
MLMAADVMHYPAEFALPADSLCIGIEIGGTKLQAVLGTPDGRVVELERNAVESHVDGGGIRAMLPPLLDTLLAHAGVSWHAVRAIGIGFGGPVAAQAGVVLRSFQVPGWDNFPLVDWAIQTWGRPTVIANDAAAAGLGEATLGAGRGARRVFYITIGSGIGGGWIVDGRIDDGQGIGMAELGHTYVPDPQTGQAVELESVCSGWAIGRRARAAATAAIAAAAEGPRGTSHLLRLAPSPADIDARIVYAAAAAGDILALRILQETTTALGVALANVIALFHPHVIVIGGGVSLMGPLFWEGLRAEVAQRALGPYAPSVRIEQAALGEEVVPIGALCLVASRP